MKIESCEFHQTLNTHILGVRDSNLKNLFREMFNYYSLIVNDFLSHCENFSFSYFFLSLDHSATCGDRKDCNNSILVTLLFISFITCTYFLYMLSPSSSTRRHYPHITLTSKYVKASYLLFTSIVTPEYNLPF